MISGIFSTSSSLSSLTENDKTLFLLSALFEQHSSAITVGKKLPLGCQTFRNKAHRIGGQSAEVTRIANGPFLSYRDFSMAIAIPGLVREWFYFTARDSRTSPGLAGEGLSSHKKFL